MSVITYGKTNGMPIVCFTFM